MSLPGVKIPDKHFQLELPDEKTGGCSILMVGSTRSGKSTALKHILDKYFKKHLGCLFSNSIHANAYNQMRSYSNLAPSGIVIPELVKDAYLINRETKNHYNWLFIYDDTPMVRSDKELLKLLTIYRNSGVSGIVATQSPTLLNPTCRSNFNFVMLFKLNATEQQENVIKVWLRGYFPQGWNYEQKIRWYRQQTEDHHFLFIDNLQGTIQRCRIDTDE
jgi:hypothetical protein